MALRAFSETFCRRRVHLGYIAAHETCSALSARRLAGAGRAVAAFQPDGEERGPAELGQENDRVDAEIQTWPVPKVLQQITAATGWKVLVEPGIKEVVSTKFKNKPAGDALERLLGDLNYALIPQTNGPSSCSSSAPRRATPRCPSPRPKNRPTSSTTNSSSPSSPVRKSTASPGEIGRK